MKIQLFVKQQLSRLLLSLMLFSSLLTVGTTTLFSADVIDIGSRRELFADDFLIGKLAGDVKQVLHQPDRKKSYSLPANPGKAIRAPITRSSRMAISIACITGVPTRPDRGVKGRIQR